MDQRESGENLNATPAPSTSDLFARLARLQEETGAAPTPSTQEPQTDAAGEMPDWFVAETASRKPQPKSSGLDANAFDVDSWRPSAGPLPWDEPAPQPAASGFGDASWTAPAQTGRPEGMSWEQTLAAVPAVVADADEPVGVIADTAPHAEHYERGERGERLEGDLEQAGRKRRKTRRIVLVVILIILALAAAGVGFYLHQGVDAGVKELDQALSLIEETDAEVIAVDTAVHEQVSADTVGTLTSVVSEARSLQPTLDEALTHAEAAQAARWVGNDKRKAVAEAAAADIAARKEMIDAGTQIIEADYDAYRASDYLNQAWPLVIDADSKARSSSARASAATTDNMGEELPEAISEAKAAAASLTTAAELIEQAQSAMPDADFSSILTYIEAKQAAIARAIEADEAMLNGSRSDHDSAIEAFSEADAAAVSAAMAMPTDPSTIITGAYEQLTTGLVERYDAARTSLVEADASIRDYLGVTDLAGEEVAASTES